MLITASQYARKISKHISVVYERIYLHDIKPVEDGRPAYYDLKTLETALKLRNPRRKNKKDEPVAEFVSPRNHNCPEYSACLDEAAFKNTGLKCSGCANEKASIKSLDIDFTETTREMSGSTVYRIPFK